MKNIKMKLVGMTLVMLGIAVLVYGLFFYSGPSTFWSIYIGMSVIMTGLGLIGFNIGYGI